MAFDIGDTVTAFGLPDTDGEIHTVPADPAPAATVLVVTCNHCPYVGRWNGRLKAAAEDYGPKGVRFLGINPNDAERYPADSLDRMREFVRDHGFPDPYLRDEDQSVAAALGAQTTPHVFVLDSEHRLRYRGAPDSDNHDPSQNAAWLRAALDAVLAGERPEPAQTEARGCSVKWRA